MPVITYRAYRLDTGAFNGAVFILPTGQRPPEIVGVGMYAGDVDDDLSKRVDPSLFAIRQAAIATATTALAASFTEEELEAANAQLDAAMALPGTVDYQPDKPQDDARRTWAWSTETKRWVSTPTPEALNADAGAVVKAKRSRLLDETDWLLTRSIELGTALSPDWRTYRQALRDVTLQPGYPHDIVWPAQP